MQVGREVGEFLRTVLTSTVTVKYCDARIDSDVARAAIAKAPVINDVRI